MKKQKKKDNTPAAFAAKPFNSLKGFHAETKGPEGKAAPPAPPPLRPPEADDAAIFMRVVADVKRLHPAQGP
ncbi:MAG TPA: hypothetical protein VHN12_05570 [Geobacteraceae bacterium]|nr:hypothetical protein [Geobacteraceae bacterium]